MRLIRHIFLITCLLIAVRGSAQISRGGDPLPADMLRSVSADFYTEMPSFDVKQMLTEDSLQNHQKGASRFAKKFNTDLRPDNAGVQFTLSDGTKVWRCGIRSRGAYSINLLFSQYYVPKGAKLFIYNSDRTSKIGAFTEDNNSKYMTLPTAPVYGDEIIVEYQEPANADFKGMIAIGEVNHDYRGLTMRSRPGALSSNQTCHKDVVCYSDYADQAQAVTLLIINGNEYCTGCLVNNVEQDGTPYLLSAAHCFLPANGITSETRAQNTVIFFNYKNPSCSNVIIGSEEYSMASADLLVNEKNIDVALLRLTQIPPVYYRPYYAGWNAGTLGASPYYCLHHPAGKSQKVAIENDNLVMSSFDDSGLSYTIEPNIHWKVPSWEVGTTEGGSSGSPLFDASKRIVGTLTGGSSYCNSPYNDFYAALQKVWTYYPESSRQLKYWLDPKSTGTLQIDGMNPYPSASCERLSHIGSTEKVGVSYTRSPETGPVFSKNSLQVQECAERFVTGKKTTVYGVQLVLPAWKSSMNGQLEINLYDGYDTPGAQPLASKTVQLSYLNYNGGFTSVAKPNTTANDNFVLFDEPVTVDNSFFLSYKVNYSSTDTFRIYNVIDRITPFNGAYVNLQSGWIAMSSFDNSKMNTSLWMDPIVHNGGTVDSLIDTTAEKVLVVYQPFPLSQSFFFKGLSWNENYRMSVYNSAGQIVKTDPDVTPVSYYHTWSMPKGVYLIDLASEKSSYKLKLLIY